MQLRADGVSRDTRTRAQVAVRRGGGARLPVVDAPACAAAAKGPDEARRRLQARLHPARGGKRARSTSAPRHAWGALIDLLHVCPGFVLSTIAVATSLYNGRGVAPDRNKALEMLSALAKDGCQPAARELQRIKGGEVPGPKLPHPHIAKRKQKQQRRKQAKLAKSSDKADSKDAASAEADAADAAAASDNDKAHQDDEESDPYVDESWSNDEDDEDEAEDYPPWLFLCLKYQTNRDDWQRARDGTQNDSDAWDDEIAGDLNIPGNPHL